MARQKLIHLHTSGLTSQSSVLTEGEHALSLGEIAVQHNPTTAKLYIRLSDASGTPSNNIATFVDQTQVEHLISLTAATISNEIGDLRDSISAETTRATSAETTLRDAIAEIRQSISSATSDTTALQEALSAETQARREADSALSQSITTNAGNISQNTTDIGNLQQWLGEGFENKSVAEQLGDGFAVSSVTQQLAAVKTTADGALQSIASGTSHDYVTVTIGEKSNNSQTVSVEVATAEVATATTVGAGLADAKDVKNYVDGQVGLSNTAINDINDKIGTGFSKNSGETVAEQLAAVKATADGAIQLVASGTSHDYVTVTVTAPDSAQTQTVSVEVATAPIASATTNTHALADVYDVKTYVDGLDSEMNRRVSGLETDNTNTKSMLDGFAVTQGSVKDYVDNTVATQVSSVYKVKGTKQTYADLIALPESGNTIGDVWNVVAQSVVGTAPNQTVYPAGTNFVWTGTEWDALGGTVDLSPYMLTSTFDTWSGGTYTQKINAIESSANTEYDARIAGDNALQAQLGQGFTSAATVADAIHDLETATTETNEAISAEESARTEADAAINAKIGNGFTSASGNTITDRMVDVENKASDNQSSISDIEETIGSGFTNTSGNTITDKFEALATTANGAVQSVSVKNTATNGITATEDTTSHDVELNFDAMVIDCGTY